MLYVDEEPVAEVWARLLMQRDESDALKAFTLYSHASFFFSLGILILYSRRPYEAILNFLALATSVFYHACLAFDRCAQTNVFVMRAEDYITANLQIVVIISLLTTSRPGRSLMTGGRGSADFFKIFVPFQIIFVAFALLSDPYSIYIAYVALAAALIAALSYPLFFRTPARLHLAAGAYAIEPLAVAMHWLVAALVCFGIAITFYLVNMDSSWAHSAWHVFAGFGIGFLALAVDEEPVAPVTVLEYEVNWEKNGSDTTAQHHYKVLLKRARERVKRELPAFASRDGRELLYLSKRAPTNHRLTVKTV